MSEHWRQYANEGLQTAGGPVPFALEQWRFLFPIFLALKRTLPNGGRLLDVGCGTGIFTALLAHHGYRTVGVDNDPEIVEKARQMVEYFRSSAHIEQGSAFDLSRYHGQFDLAYSLGVVEHFEPAVTVRLIAEQARCARFVLVGVPTRFTKYAGTITDERPYRRRQLIADVRRAGLTVRECFLFGEPPTRTATMLERCAPGVVRRRFASLFDYGMTLVCVGEIAQDATTLRVAKMSRSQSPA